MALIVGDNSWYNPAPLGNQFGTQFSAAPISISDPTIATQGAAYVAPSTYGGAIPVGTVGGGTLGGYPTSTFGAPVAPVSLQPPQYPTAGPVIPYQQQQPIQPSPPRHPSGYPLDYHEDPSNYQVAVYEPAGPVGSRIGALNADDFPPPPPAPPADLAKLHPRPNANPLPSSKQGALWHKFTRHGRHKDPWI